MIQSLCEGDIGGSYFYLQPSGSFGSTRFHERREKRNLHREFLVSLASFLTEVLQFFQFLQFSVYDPHISVRK